MLGGNAPYTLVASVGHGATVWGGSGPPPSRAGKAAGTSPTSRDRCPDENPEKWRPSSFRRESRQRLGLTKEGISLAAWFSTDASYVPAVSPDHQLLPQ